MFDLEEEVVPTSKRARGACVAPKSVTVPVISVVYLARVSQVTMELERREYDMYHGASVNINETGWETGADGV